MLLLVFLFSTTLVVVVEVGIEVVVVVVFAVVVVVVFVFDVVVVIVVAVVDRHHRRGMKFRSSFPKIFSEVRRDPDFGRKWFPNKISKPSLKF